MFIDSSTEGGRIYAIFVTNDIFCLRKVKMRLKQQKRLKSFVKIKMNEQTYQKWFAKFYTEDFLLKKAP